MILINKIFVALGYRNKAKLNDIESGTGIIDINTMLLWIK